MRPINQQGPRLLGAGVPDVRPVPVGDVREALTNGAQLVDLRPAGLHAAGHVPGSLSIPRGSSFGTWLGWVADPEKPIVLLLERPEDADEALRQALRVGYESIVGHVQGGYRAWAEAGGPVASGGRLDVRELADRLRRDPAEAPVVIDVRQPGEYEGGHVPGAWHVAAGDLQDRLADLPRDRPIATVCASGYRSSVAASLLRAAGFTDVHWVADGLPTWEAAGLPVETGRSSLDERS
jgi:hydroxyacylglutathione hydrolase